MLDHCVLSSPKSTHPLGSNHSTALKLSLYLNDILITTDSVASAVLVMLDLSSAFDTVCHEILISRLTSHVGQGGLNWFKSFLTNRRFVVNTGSFLSTPGNLTCGVPQGFI